jgi:hypothetical protein
VGEVPDTGKGEPRNTLQGVPAYGEFSHVLYALQQILFLFIAFYTGREMSRFEPRELVSCPAAKRTSIIVSSHIYAKSII